ncbi:MAG TPA: CBS domain-containing protein [Solirubrobacteraceae bacterium]|nr:CBS domain-containing protein [Solirubrobacteraceae bacterium]
MLPLSQLIRSPLVDRSGEQLGRVEDVIVRLGGDGLPPVTGIKARIGGRELFVPTSRIADLERGAIRLSKDKLNLGRFERRPGEVLLREDVLHHRLIDVHNARLVTAREIELEQVDGRWRVLGILAQRRSPLHRLLAGARGDGSRREPEGGLISWDRLEPFVGHVPSSRLRIGSRRLARLHPAQIADLVEAASHDQGEEIIRAVGADHELEADIFEELDDEHQVEFVAERSDQEAATLLARMATDDAADLIAQLPQERRANVLALLPGPQRRHVQALLGYDPRTAGGLMSPEFVTVPSDGTVADAVAAVRGSDCPDEALGTILLVDGAGRLAGAVTALALLRAEPQTPLCELAAEEVQVVRPDAELPEIASLMSDYNLIALPVIDDDGRAVGVVTVDDVLELSLPRDWRLRHRASRD